MASSIKDLREHGFTLVELMVAMVIIGVLAVGGMSLFMAQISGAYTERIMSIAQKIENSSVSHPEIKPISTTGDVNYNYFVSSNDAALPEMPEFDKNTTIRVENGKTLKICVSLRSSNSYKSNDNRPLNSYIYDSSTNEVKKEKC